jgi:hypothetical protein
MRVGGCRIATAVFLPYVFPGKGKKLRKRMVR